MSETKPDNLPKFDFSKLPKDYTRFDFWKDYVYCMRPNRPPRDEIILVKMTDQPSDLRGAVVAIGDLAKHFGIPKSMLVAELNNHYRWPSFGMLDDLADYTACCTPTVSAAAIECAADLTDPPTDPQNLPMVSAVLVRLGSKLGWWNFTASGGRAPTVPSEDELRAIAVTEINGWTLDEDALENNPAIANFFRVYRPGEKVEGYYFQIGWVPQCWNSIMPEFLTSSALTAVAIRSLFERIFYLNEDMVPAAISDLQKPFGKARVGRYTRSSYCAGHISQVCNWLARLHADPNVAIDQSGEYLDFYNADNGKTIRLVFKDELPKIIKKAHMQRPFGAPEGEITD